MGDWSTSWTALMDSKPVTEVDCGLRIADCGIFFLGRAMAFWTAGKRHSRIKLLLPEPLTPVTAMNRPRGNFTVRSFRLLVRAWWRTRLFTGGNRGNGEGDLVFDFLSRVTTAATIWMRRRAPRAGRVLC